MIVRGAWLTAIAALGLMAMVAGGAAAADSSIVLDRFDNARLWTAAASNGVTARIAGVDDGGQPALRLDFDLGGTAGYALASRALPLDVPPNYELTLWIRAEAPINDFQLKLVDASGDNVWWYHRRNVDFAREWQQLRIRKRQIEFAWGPTSNRELRRVARIELVVAAGRGGGSGSIYFRALALRELPPAPVTWPKPTASASSFVAGAEPAQALDGDVATAWRSDPAQGAEQTLTIDFGTAREFGGLIVRWEKGAHASRYDVQLSDDRQRWRTVRSVTAGRGGPDALLLADAETRYLRLALHEGPGRGYGLAELELEDVDFGASPNAFFQALARESPRGFYPRGFSGQQSYWTIVGIDGGGDSGLLSEDGALEVASGGFSIEPFVATDENVTTWADVVARPTLVDRYLPMPGVEWRHRDWQLRISTFASGTRERSALTARYTLENTSARPLSLQLVFAVRPFQVNPPAQFLNVEGGVSGIGDLAWDGKALAVDGRRAVHPLSPPNRIGMAPFDAGPVPRWLRGAAFPDARSVHDSFGYASGALVYDVSLAPGAATSVALVVPLSGVAPDVGDASLVDRDQAVAADWTQKLNLVAFDVPPAAQPLVDTLRTALAHLLIIRDGPILRPGTRAYARSWIRDGAMMSEALLRMGHATAAIDYLRWFAPHQFADGRIPCCVDARGADPVAENDSDGEFVFLVDEVWRYTRDRALVDAMWPHVTAAMNDLEALRRSGPATEDALSGLLPASISHEGYAAKPMHSYWDDFWAAKGYAAGVDLAAVRGTRGEATRWEASERAFRRDLARSLAAAMAAHRIAYVPGAAELGDFDPTSTAIAFAPGVAALDPASAAVQATFERYWREFVARRDGAAAWREYTPYELRIVGTFVRLGWRERAHALIAFFLAGRRPPEWNQWAEVVGNDAREIRFVGDMPHGWVESDFIRSVLDLFAYERQHDRAIVIGRGIPPEWLGGPGVAIRSLRTPYGTLSYSMRKKSGRTVLAIDASSDLPPGGFVVVADGAKLPPAATINGKRAPWRGRELRIAELPATVVVNDQ